jgi:hypothetical protein
VLWTAHATKMGYRWKLGNGKSRFWEDLWFGNCSLAIQFLEIYTIVNEQNITWKNACDGVNLKFTFRRTVDNRLMALWLELKQIASSIQLDGGDDTIIWQFNSSGKYYVQSLHTMVNDRAVRDFYPSGLENSCSF